MTLLINKAGQSAGESPVQDPLEGGVRTTVRLIQNNIKYAYTIKRKRQAGKVAENAPRLRVGSGEAVLYPEIMLAGKWLQRMGFNPGDAVRVTVRHKVLIVELEEIPEWEYV